MNPKGNFSASTAVSRPSVVRQTSARGRTTLSLRHSHHAAQPAPSVHAHREGDPPLIRVLLREANRRSHGLVDIARALECTPSYLEQLRAGQRKPEHIGQEFSEAASAYLGIPTVLVKLLAGRLTARDFLWPQRTQEQEIADCLRTLCEDPVIGAYVPNDLLVASPEVQQFVWQLYTECAEMHPWPIRTLPRALQYLQRAAQGDTAADEAFDELRSAMSGSAKDN
jgi:hypothetical protein